MNRWVTTIIESNAADSVKKAKADVCDIAKGMDYQPLYIYRYIDENEDDYALTSRIDGITAGVANQDRTALVDSEVKILLNKGANQE